jgi:predicted acetyltransferase
VQLTEQPHLVPPTIEVADSWLAGERAYSADQGLGTELLDEASADFAKFVAQRQGVRILWGVPSTLFWYVAGQEYIGELVIRHELTPELERVGGHIGYSISPLWRRQGHATRMLAAGLAQCRLLGLRHVLLTCAADNEPSRRVILANGGIPDGQADGEDRFWISI